MSAESSEMLVKESPLRGGNFQPREVPQLPLPLLNPVSLARILPGATEAAGSTVTSGLANTGGFSINGQRPRGNNYLLDGTDNNEVWLRAKNRRSPSSTRSRRSRFKPVTSAWNSAGPAAVFLT